MIERRSEITPALRDVIVERYRQVNDEHFSADHDDEHDEGELGMAAACYAMEGASNLMDALDAGEPPSLWPWDEEWWKPTTHRQNCVKAAALIIAEIERLDRMEVK